MTGQWFNTQNILNFGCKNSYFARKTFMHLSNHPRMNLLSVVVTMTMRYDFHFQIVLEWPQEDKSLHYYCTLWSGRGGRMSTQTSHFSTSARLATLLKVSTFLKAFQKGVSDSNHSQVCRVRLIRSVFFGHIWGVVLLREESLLFNYK